MSTLTDVNARIVSAMKAHDQTALSAYRMLKAALMNKEVEKGHALVETEALQVVAAQRGVAARRAQLARRLFEIGRRPRVRGVHDVAEPAQHQRRRAPAAREADDRGLPAPPGVGDHRIFSVERARSAHIRPRM